MNVNFPEFPLITDPKKCKMNLIINKKGRTVLSNIFDIFRKLEQERGAESSVPVTHIVAGLGNPGDKYHWNHHNLGFLALDCIEQQKGVRTDRSKFKSLCADVRIGERRVLLLRPQTFMNNSGEAVGEAAGFYKIPPENVIVMHDDIALPVGKLRIRSKGSDGGQKGVRSIINHLGTENFTRIRIGAGAPPPGVSIIDWVLTDIAKADRDATFDCLMKCLPAIELITDGKLGEAMNRFN